MLSDSRVTLLCLGSRAGLGEVFAEEEPAVVASEEEGEAVEVGAERVRAVGRVADKAEQRSGEALGVGGQPGPIGLWGLTAMRVIPCSTRRGCSCPR